MNKIKNLRRNKKGFTLVEVIVVLVILAILIAIAVPSVMKYIDDANDAKYLAQGRAAYIAAEAELAKDFADDKKLNGSIYNEGGAAETTNAKFVAAVAAASDVNVNKIEVTGATIPDNTNQVNPNNITEYKITFDGKVVTITKNGSSTVEDAPKQP